MSTPLTLGQATVGIITALPTELAAVREVFSPAKTAPGKSGTVYDLYEVPCVDGQILVAATLLPVMGNNLATAVTMTMLRDCENVRHVVMVTEEFGDWEDSKRRIDLLAIDKQANLVVIELKRTQDGGHMELQAIRYASMVSAMTFERAEQIHAEFLTRIGQPATEARARLLEFLSWEDPGEETFADDVRILLVSEDFGKELTTAVLWLRDHDIDIRCVRLRPYLHGTTKLIDVQQIIPLPEAQEYQIQLREKVQLERKQQSQKGDLRLRFFHGVVAFARAKKTRHANIKPGVNHWISASAGYKGLILSYVALQDYCSAELYIDRGVKEENKQIFDALAARKDEIDKAFGSALSWERLDDKRACRIKHVLPTGSFLSPESEWPQIQEALVDAMTRLESALKPALDSLKL